MKQIKTTPEAIIVANEKGEGGPTFIRTAFVGERRRAPQQTHSRPIARIVFCYHGKSYEQA